MSDIRWFTETKDGHSQWYASHFRELAARGDDLDGEARLVDAVVAPGSRILDAGCGQGRTGAALHRRGHTVTGVDVDPVLIEAARVDYPGPTWVLADLATLDLASGDPSGDPSDGAFDAVVMAGNVITFVAPGTEQQVLASIARHVRPDAPLITGFHTARMQVADFDRHALLAGWAVEQRFATWDLRPWHADADFAVTILRAPAQRSSS